MQSIWSKETELTSRAALGGDLTVEVAVIGGGMAGILTAYMLQKKGKNVVLLEAQTIGSGQTKNSTAKITSQHNIIYNRLIHDFGIEKAKQYADANEAAVAMYRSIVAEEHIDCHFENRPAYLYSADESSVLMNEAQAAKRLGISAEFTTDTSLPFDVCGAVRFEGQAQFNPLEFIGELAKQLTIYEHTEVKKAEGNRLITEHGVITAGQVVFATHYPFLLLPGLYPVRMHQERSYVIALENAQQLEGMYIGVD
ncbi:MAG: FAD-binding oxidoreductase, partial [Angelakisella sp.]